MCVYAWNIVSEYHYATLVENVTPDSVAWMDYQTRLADRVSTATQRSPPRSAIINSQALTMGANDIFHALALLFIALIPVVWLARPPFRAIGTVGGH